MTHLTLTKTLIAIAVTSAFSFSASMAYAQSTEEVVGSAIGGTLGAIIGGEFDKRGSRTEGHVIGGIVGGTLGYVIGGELDKDNDLRRRYEGRSGEYITYGGEPYRRHRNDQYGFVSIRIGDRDPYFYRDGRKKAHPVFAEHPGRGKGKGLRKHKHKHKHQHKHDHRQNW